MKRKLIFVFLLMSFPAVVLGHWRVTWKVTATEMAECPDYKPDPYTGQWPGTHCAVLHTKTVERSMMQEFPTRDEAVKFIEGATCREPRRDPWSFSLTGNAICKEFGLEEIMEITQ